MICYMLPDLPQRLQCSYEEKVSCLKTVKRICELSYLLRREGVLALEETVKEDSPFWRAAVDALIYHSEPEALQEVLFSYLAAENLSGKLFLEHFLIAQGVLLFALEEIPPHIPHKLKGWFGAEFAPVYMEAFAKPESKKKKHPALTNSFVAQFDCLARAPKSRLDYVLHQTADSTLALALKGAGKAVERRLLAVMGTERAETVRQQMSDFSYVRRQDVEEAQNEMLRKTGF